MLVDRLSPRSLRTQNAALTLWLKEFALSAESRKWLGRDPARGTQIAQRYRAEPLRSGYCLLGNPR